MSTKSYMHKILPSDIIMEILIWTDIESLPPLRWVCKEWRLLISHPHFMSRHHQKAKNICGYIVDNTCEQKDIACRNYEIDFLPHPSPKSEPLPSLTFMLEPVKIHASTPHGLLLCFGLVNERYYVCKPTTKEWATIPTPNTQNLAAWMIMSVASTSPLRFRIMRISWIFKKLQFFCEVFDSDTCGMWKMIESVGSFLDGNRHSLVSVRKGVVVNESFFWIERREDYRMTQIVCFDLWAEELKTMELPKDVVTKHVTRDMISRLSNFNGGVLGLVHWDNYFIEFWAMTGVGEKRWEKMHVLDMSFGDPLRPAFGWMMDDFVLNSTVLINRPTFRRKIFWYNLKEDNYVETSIHADSINKDDLYFFKSDYFPCNISECQYYKIAK